MFVFRNLLFGKSLSKRFCICLTLEKLVNEKYFPVNENLAWFPRKCFPVKFRRKILSESCEKFRNVILFANYIKFDPQTFDCYIYFVLNIYFSISSLKI
jgi:hypothetical protein